MAGQVKSKQRVADHGEVFTSEREVKAMCDLVANECLRIESRFLEPACGEGAFLAEILSRKLTTVRSRFGGNPCDYELYAIEALSSIYGIDILSDNTALCRERLFNIWNSEYTSVCKDEASDEARAVAKHILERNIICGNALTMKCVTEEQKDTENPIIFSEWSFPFGDRMIKRRDFRFDDLELKGDDRQGQLFGEPEPIAEFPPIDYRRLAENDK